MGCVVSSWWREFAAESQKRNFCPFLFVFYLTFNVFVNKNWLLHVIPTITGTEWISCYIWQPHWLAKFHAHLPFLPWHVFIIKSTLAENGRSIPKHFRISKKLVHNFSISGRQCALSQDLCYGYQGDCMEIVLFSCFPCRNQKTPSWKQLKWKNSSDSFTELIKIR